MLIARRDQKGLWEQSNFLLTPLARQLSRLMREEAGTSEEFDSITYVSEVALKLECMLLIGILNAADPSEAGTLGFAVTNTDGFGIWADALQKCLNALTIASRAETLPLTQAYTEKLSGENASVLDVARNVWIELGEADASFFSRNRLGIMQFFVALRNRTRGHGATTGSQYEAINGPLLELLSWLIETSPLLSGELVRPMKVKGEAQYSCRLLRGFPTQEQVLIPAHFIDRSDQLYYKFGNGYLPLPDWLLYTRDDDSCYFLNSRRARSGQSQFLDYLTNQRKSQEVTWFLTPPPLKPPSATAGLEQLNWDDTPVNNLPTVDFSTYVQRSLIESELNDYLEGNAVNFVSLRGAGGAGKTTLALRAIRRVANQGNDGAIKFDFIIWFSARDTDLDEYAGPLLRRRQASSLGACADIMVKLLEPLFEKPKDQSPEDFFAERLASGKEKYLLVFDNFESFDDTPQLQRFVKKYLAYPSKALITSREDTFHGDVPIEVGGLSRDEARDLIMRTARRAGCEPRITEGEISRIFEWTLGNPYAIKLVVNEFSRSASMDAVLPRAMNEDYLSALFRRSFERSEDDAQYLFLLVALSPLARLERFAKIFCAGRQIDYDRAKDSLIKAHLIDQPDAVNGQPVYRVSWAAQEFAKKILIGNRLERALERDIKLLAELQRNQIADKSNSALFEFLEKSVEAAPDGDPSIKDRNKRIQTYILERDARVAATYAIESRRTRSLSDDEQRRAFKRAVELDPSVVSVWLAWSAFEKSIGDYQFSLDLCLRAADHSDNVETLLEVGRRITATLSDFKEYVPLLRRRVYTESVIARLAAHMDEFDGIAYSVLAWLELISDRRADARRVVERGLAQYPDVGELLKLRDLLSGKRA